MSIVKEAAWTISNIIAGNVGQIQAVINADLIRYLNHIMMKVRSHWCWTTQSIITTLSISNLY